MWMVAVSCGCPSCFPWPGPTSVPRARQRPTGAYPGIAQPFPAVPPAEQDMREVGLPVVGRAAEPGFRSLSTAARFPRVLSTDSGSRPYGSAIPAALRAGTPDERRQSWAGWGVGLGE